MKDAIDIKHIKAYVQRNGIIRLGNGGGKDFFLGRLIDGVTYNEIEEIKIVTKEEFITERTRIISEMLDNPDKHGIYPTTKCFKELDVLYDRIIQEKV